MATLPFSTYTYWHNSGTNSPSGNDVRHRFNLSLVSQSGLTSTIKVIAYYQVANVLANAYVQAGYYRNGSLQTPTREITVNGTQSSGWYQTGTWTFTVTHNVDGTANFTFQGRGRVGAISGGWTDYRYTSVESVTLPTIPRYATINSWSATVTSPKDIAVSWKANVTCDRVEYSTNGGSTYSLAQTGDRTSGSFTISNLNPNTTYSVRIRVRRKDSQLWTQSSSSSRTTHKLSTITSSGNFNIGDDIPITIDRQNSDYTHRVRLQILKDGFNLIKTLYDIGSSTIMQLNQDELDSIYALIPDQSTAQTYFEVRTEKGGVAYGSTVIYGTATVVNANPVFSNFTYEDINATTLALTDDDQTIVKNYSNLKATVSLENKAVAQKGANMVKYRLVVGAKQIDVNYDDENAVELTLNAIDNNVFIVYAIDSRNNSTVVQKSPNVYIDYFHPTINTANAERTGGIQAETTLTFNGVFFNASFGLVTNDLTATYKYKKTSDSEWTDGTTTLILTKDGNNYSFEGLIAGDKGALGFDSQYSYNIKIIATDKLSSDEYDLILGTGKPNMAIHRDGVAFGAPYDEELEGFQIVDKKITFNGLELFKWVEEEEEE
jgi:hypothetical protein